MFKQVSPNTVLGIILVLAAALRFVGLTQSPPSLYWEEAALGYDAYSILKTGKDYHGNSWPVVAFESFGDYKPSGYFYVTVPSIAIFGLTPFAVRLPSVLAGIFAVFLIYHIAKELEFSELVALFSAATLAILPWHLQFSRAAFEVSLATTFMLLGLWLLLKSRKKPLLLPLSTLSFVVSAYTYHGLRLLAPLLAAFTFFYYFKQFKPHLAWLAISAAGAAMIMLPLLIGLAQPEVNQRFRETSLFSVSQAVEVVNQRRAEDGNTLLARLIHHRYWYWGREVVQGMLEHVNPNFLFIKGDSNPRHQAQPFALLFWWQIIPLIALVWLKKKHAKSTLFLLGWILLASLPPALTKTTPHTLRFLPAAAAFAVLTGTGMQTIFNQINHKKLLRATQGVLLTMAVACLGAYLYHYHIVYPKESSQSWQYGYAQLVKYVKEDQYKYQQVYVTREFGRPSIYFLFYTQYPPEKIQTQEPALPQDQSELLAYDKYVFTEAQEQYKENSLRVTAAPLPDRKPLHTIQFLNGSTAFYIYEI